MARNEFESLNSRVLSCQETNKCRPQLLDTNTVPTTNGHQARSHQDIIMTSFLATMAMREKKQQILGIVQTSNASLLPKKILRHYKMRPIQKPLLVSPSQTEFCGRLLHGARSSGQSSSNLTRTLQRIFTSTKTLKGHVRREPVNLRRPDPHELPRMAELKPRKPSKSNHSH